MEMTVTPTHELIELVRGVVRSELDAAAKPETPDEYLSRPQAAELLNVSLPTLRQYERRGAIKGRRIGRRVLFNRVELVKALESSKRKLSV